MVFITTFLNLRRQRLQQETNMTPKQSFIIKAPKSQSRLVELHKIRALTIHATELVVGIRPDLLFCTQCILPCIVEINGDLHSYTHIKNVFMQYQGNPALMDLDTVVFDIFRQVSLNILYQRLASASRGLLKIIRVASYFYQFTKKNNKLFT